MRVSREEAHSVVAARKRMRTIWAGQAVLVIPFMDGAAYHSTHYVPELKKSLQCIGEVKCQYHYLIEIQKMHVPCWVHREVLKFDQGMALQLDGDHEFNPSRWMKQIVEITEGCFEQAERTMPEGTPAVIGRPHGRKNGPLAFRWLEDCNVSVPPEHRYNVDQSLPLVIDKVYRTHRTGTDLDNPPPLGTKQNSNSKSAGYADGIGGAL